MTEEAAPPPPVPEDERQPPEPDAPARVAPPPSGAAPAEAAPPPWRRYVHLAVLATFSLALDLGTKGWAKGHLEGRRRMEVVTDHLYFTFAKNRGGAWGLLQNEPESIRRPFFVVISVLAIVFIVSLYRRLTPQQWALRWGLPLVLGGALGNLINRIQFNYVVDFIDYSASWVAWVQGLFSGAVASDHWPTFNIADVAIVAGVVLMGVDMFTTRKTPKPAAAAPASTGAPKPPQIDPAEPPAPVEP
jgi:signal peptidase II